MCKKARAMGYVIFDIIISSKVVKHKMHVVHQERQEELPHEGLHHRALRFYSGHHSGAGNAVSNTDFIEFYRKCLDAMSREHLVVRTVRLDSGFFSEENIEAFEGDFLFFEVVAKKYGNILHWVKECIADDAFEPFYPGCDKLDGASFSYYMKTTGKIHDFVVVRKYLGQEGDGQGMLFPQMALSDHLPQSARHDAERGLGSLQQAGKAGNFNSNFAYFRHCTIAYNLALLFKRYILTERWHNARTLTLRKNLINVPGRLVNRSGRMIMRLMAGPPFVDVLHIVKERLMCVYRVLHPAPA
ncbi:MAG: hypothetical protein M0Q23_05115 [Syntrophales bacterium]|jgi:hypothetical protein|nr:hypothetical protein [Syntrophales bacterium]MCK9528021.1 hypothetical protein [Syntrophales bacterium]MDX9921402.1 hypothetical protein [Syntrophales bacterium]